jgi:hypothetical protein
MDESLSQERTTSVSAAGEEAIEKAHSDLSNLVLQTANQVDAFYATDNFTTWENNRTNIRLRGKLDWIEKHGTNVGGEVKLNIVLPALGGRLRLVTQESDGSVNEEVSKNFSESSSLALRFIGVQRPEFGLSVSAGIRVTDTVKKDDSLSVYPRLNLRRSYGIGNSWAGRTDGRFYYYSDTGGRIDARQYLERKLSDKLFFRSRLRLQWYEEEGSAVFPELRLTTFQQLNEDRAIAYEAIAEQVPSLRGVYDRDELLIEPRDKYKQFYLRVRYRQKLKWPWLYVEFWPHIGWLEQRDYETVVAALFRLEVIFGHIDTRGPIRLDE